MLGNPFKFLDSFTKEDKNIFFGRDHETEELYQKVFESKILLVYGVTGTGKTSLINCGLANKFNDSDWLPIYVRRNQNILDSLQQEILKVSVTPHYVSPLEGGQRGVKNTLKILKNLYLDHFKPIYLLFDQFEELFIFGNKDERKAFIELIDGINQSDIQCRCLFILREEFLANITEFEKTIPEFFQNRIRIEKMSPVKALETIKGPCKAVGIAIEDEAAENILQKVSKDKSNVELTYLQVLLDKVYQTAKEESKVEISITQDIVNNIGDVEDILGDFLEQQIKTFENSEDILNILKSFVSIHGTKKQVSPEEINEHLQTFGHEIDQLELPELLQSLVSKRILKEKDEQGHYELIHDALAAKIYEKITLLEKELLEVRQFIENAFLNYERRKVYLTQNDLLYISPYRNKIFLSEKLNHLLLESENILNQKRKKRNLLTISSTVAIVITALVLLMNSFYKQKAEKEQLEMMIKNATVIINPEKMNVIYVGVENPLVIHVPGVHCKSTFPEIDQGRIYRSETDECKFYALPVKTGVAIIKVKASWENNDLRYIGKPVKFRVKSLPDPYVVLCGKQGGNIELNEILRNPKLEVSLNNFGFDLEFALINFDLSIIKNETVTTINSKSNELSIEQINLIKNLSDSSQIFIANASAIGPDGSIRKIDDAVFTIVKGK